jgi:dihydrofolate synthase/folylpolyglutamate synthase
METDTMPHFFCSNDVLNYLDSLGLFRMDFSLRCLPQILEYLDLTRPACPVIQIVGTNGKGSTSVFLAALAKEHGLRVGLYTSPHFITPCERIKINGKMPDESVLVSEGNRIMAALDSLSKDNNSYYLTYFEWLTVFALLVFMREKTDLIILEAGLGGRLDATSQIAVDIVCFTPIALDHQNILGESLEEIASDKSEAIREHGATISAPQLPVVRSILQDAALRKHCAFTEISEEDPCPPLRLRGEHQQTNARLALAAWRHLADKYGYAHDEPTQLRALSKAFIAGRLQHIAAGNGHPTLILDGAHNAHGLLALHAYMQTNGIMPKAFVFTCLADKDMNSMLFVLRKLAGKTPILIPPLPGNPRAQVPESVVKALRSIGADAAPTHDLREALDRIDSMGGDDSYPAVITGSMYLLGEFYKIWPSYLEYDTTD